MDEILSRISQAARDSGGRSRLYRWMWRNRVAFTTLLDENRPRWQALADTFAAMGLSGPDGALKAESVRNTWWRVRRDDASRKRRPSPAPLVIAARVVEVSSSDPLAELRQQMNQKSGRVS